MSLSADMLRQLAGLELSPVQMNGVLSLIACMMEKEEARLAAGRERVARHRERNAVVTLQSRDESITRYVTAADVPFSPKESSPTPPKEITPFPQSSSLRSDELSSNSLKSDEKSKRAKEIAAEFDGVFWPEYPKKSDKKSAAKSFLRARLGGTDLGRIMAGLRRYVATKPEWQAWMDPSKFLNAERFNDEPPPPTARGSPPHRMNGKDSLLQVIGEAMEKANERDRSGDFEKTIDGTYPAQPES